MEFSLGGRGGERETTTTDHHTPCPCPSEQQQLITATSEHLPNSFMATQQYSTATTSSSSKTHHHHHLVLPHHHHQLMTDHNNISFSMMQSPSPSSSSPFFSGSAAGGSKEGSGAYDLGDLDQALFLYLDHGTLHPPPNSNSNSNSNSKSNSSSSPLHQPTPNQKSSSSPAAAAGGIMRPPTLNIFPSQPMHLHLDPSNKGLFIGGGEAHPSSKRPLSLEKHEQPPKINQNHNSHVEPSKSIKREGNRKGPTSTSDQQDGPKTPDPKTLRRLAQNREAARKSRLRKKAYVQQLESSRIRLAQLEQELQRARAQGIFFGGSGGGGDQGIPVGVTNISPDAAVFDLEYTRWLEEHHRLTCELRAAVQENVPENELKMYVDNCLGHYDMVMNLKSMVAKTDVFHLVSGMWKTPAERCFMWMGGFRPSELIKIIVHQIEPLTEQQLMAICGLQQSTHEAEEALSQGLEALHQSLSDVIASDSLSCPPNMANYMSQMALAMNKLSTTENFVRQADNLRHQTFHRLNQILTIRQSARCFLAIAEYFHRLRAVSSLWLARPWQDQ